MLKLSPDSPPPHIKEGHHPDVGHHLPLSQEGEGVVQTSVENVTRRGVVS